MKRLSIPGAILAGAIAAGSPARAASTIDDLQTVLALQDKPCAIVTGFELKAENDFIVTCSGNRTWRVHIDDQGRVRVEKR